MTARRILTVAAALAVVVSACGDAQPLFSSPVTTAPATLPPTTGQETTTTTVGPGTSLPPPSTTSATTTTTIDTRPLTMDELVQLTVADLEEFWSQTLPVAYDVEYVSVDGAVPYYPSTGEIPSCGGESIPEDVATGNAFYCQPDDYVAWDAEGLFPQLFTEFGDFAVALVLAHEWGHVVQRRGRVRGPTIMTELQADCFAGAWSADIAAGGRSVLQLEEGDLEEAMAGYLLFRDPPGTSPTDPSAHGSAFDRVAAFQDGFFEGVGRCERYERGEYEVVDIPLTQFDLETGGDLAFDEVVPLLTQALESFWTATYPQLFGDEWVPVADFVAYFPSTGQLPACGDRPVDPADYQDSAFYCPAGDFVAWDAERLFPDLYQSIGDFAVGMVLSNLWGTAVQHRAGLPIEGVGSDLQADCFSGAFAAAALPFDNTTGIFLSAGDLDEAVSTFLLFSESGDGTSAPAFERFDAFEDGFMNGAAACLDR